MDYEKIRIKLRDLIKFIPADERVRYETNFADDVVSLDWNESQLDNDDLINYKKECEKFILGRVPTTENRPLDSTGKNS